MSTAQMAAARVAHQALADAMDQHPGSAELGEVIAAYWAMMALLESGEQP